MKDLSEVKNIRITLYAEDKEQDISIVMPVVDGPLNVEGFRQSVEQLAEMMLVQLGEVPAIIDSADGTVKPNQKFIEKYGNPYKAAE